MSDNFEWAKHIRATLDSTFYCSIATSGSDGVWVNPVYFAYDAHLNLYFISIYASRHMQNIRANGAVAVAIYATDQPPGQDVRGIQMSGTAQLIPDEEVPDACDIYYGRAGASEAVGGKPDVRQHMGDDATWKFVKVVPGDVFYFDTSFFDEVLQGRQLVPVSQIKGQL